MPIEDGEPPRRSVRFSVIVGLVLGLIGAGAGYFIVVSGLFPTQAKTPSDLKPAETVEQSQIVRSDYDIEGISFVPLDPIHLSVGSGQNRRQLKFQAQVEVPVEAVSDVEKLKPRIADLLNGYLRAIGPSDLDDPLALTKLRGQMLRRVKLIIGHNRVNDLLIVEFVLN